MSLPGDENPNPQWQQPQPQSEWQREPPARWQQPAPPHQYAGWVAPPRTPGQAYAAMILGIVGLVVCPLLPSVAALILGYQAKSEIDRAAGQLGGRGIAMTGIVLGWVAVGFWALIVLIVVAAAAV